jgi:dihydroxyacetone kinase
MSLDTCTVPGAAKEARIAAGHAELGLGIHGEPGVQQVAFDNARSAMQMVLQQLQPKLGQGSTVVMLNNLGSTTPLEMTILANELCQSSLCGNVEFIIGPALMMTSLDMHGFSVSVLPVNDAQLAALQTPVDLTPWPSMQRIERNTLADSLPAGITPETPPASEHAETRATITAVCNLLEAAESKLNELDAKSGDGDTGSTLATAARALNSSLDRMPLADLTQLLPALGNELSQTMGGSSGVIMAIFFNAAGDACARGLSIQEALAAGLQRVSEVGGAVSGDRTMIDALQPALDALPSGIAAAATAARKGADGTASIGKAKAGRAAYVPEDNLIGHNDPGAEAVALVFEGLADTA